MNSLHQPTISVVVPSYNQGTFLEETLDSLLSQNYPSLEVIVIDGGSNDNSQSVIRRFENHLKYWQSQPDRGQSHAINIGLEKCSGELFNWLNSDDTLLPQALASIAENYQALAVVKGDPLAISGRTITTDATGVRVSDYSAQIPEVPEERFTQLRINQPGTFLPLNLVKSVSGVREDLTFTMDLDLYLRVFLEAPNLRVIQMEGEIATYRLHEGSKTCSSTDAFAIEEFAVITDLISQICGTKKIPTSVSTVRNMIQVANYTYSPRVDINVEYLLTLYIERLVFSDNLLARCCRQIGLSGGEICGTIADLLDAIGLGQPKLKSEKSAHDRAALGALWAAGSLDPNLLRLYLKSGLSVRKLRELLRFTKIY